MTFDVIHRIERVAPEVVARVLEADLETASLHEAAGRIGAMAAKIKPIYSGMRVCGPAFTVKCHPGDNLILHRALVLAQPGDVLVVDIDGYEGGPFGEQMAVVAQVRGIAGMVIDGYVRDGLRIKELGWPVFARGLCMKGTVKEAIGSINHPVSCGGVVVQPGDLVFGDDDGVVVIPREMAATAVDKAIAREAQEAESRELFLSGKTPWELAGFERKAAALGLREEPTD